MNLFKIIPAHYWHKIEQVAPSAVNLTVAGHRRKRCIYNMRDHLDRQPTVKQWSACTKQAHAGTCGVHACRRKNMSDQAGEWESPTAVVESRSCDGRRRWRRATSPGVAMATRLCKDNRCKTQLVLPGRCNNGAAAPRELAPLHHLWANTDASYRLSRIHTTMQYTQPCCTHWRTSHKLSF